jgi:hypothetical protein
MEDIRIEEAIKFANYRTTLNNQLDQAQHRMEVELLHSVNGGTFPITMELINFVDLLIRKERNEAVILDKNNTPILVTDLKEFLDTILDRYTNVTQDVHEEVMKIRKSRSVKSVLDLDLGE